MFIWPIFTVAFFQKAFTLRYPDPIDEFIKLFIKHGTKDKLYSAFSSVLRYFSHFEDSKDFASLFDFIGKGYSWPEKSRQRIEKMFEEKKD